jgi:endonuclease/exonuclease/phosphatase family metal-dependent hydrolase
MPTLYLAVLCAAAGCASPPRALRIDGRFDDWGADAPACVDPTGDGGSSGVDFGRVWVFDDADFLYLRFETGREIALQSSDGLALYLDTDDAPGTGLPVEGIGAELSWRFGSKRGGLHRNGGKTEVGAYEIGLVTGPTVTSREYEIKIRKGRDAADSAPLFAGRAVRWLLRDERGGAGDRAAGRHRFSGSAAARPVSRPLGKRSPRDVRVVSNNVYEDNLFKRREEFSRILKALSPDVLALQEIRRHDAAQVQGLVAGMLGGAWHTAHHADCFTLSRYPVLRSINLAAGVAALLDLPDSYAVDLLLVNLHLGAGTQDARRQREADEIIGMLRDLRAQGRPGALKPGTPIMLAGDFNLVGLRRQLDTLLTGDILDEGTYGPDEPPDWDGTPMTDLAPSHLAANEAWTWANYHRKGFGPGRIDYLIYTDSAASIANRFVLSTDTMADEALEAYGLRRKDTSTASDHLPVVADLMVR